MIEAGKRLLDAVDSFSITVLVIRPPPAISISVVQSCIDEVSASKYGADFSFQYVPPVDPPADCEVENFMWHFMQLHAPHVKAAIAAESTTPASALVVDFFAATILDVADEVGVPGYIYVSSTLTSVALTLGLPALHEKIPVDFEEMEGEIEIPGISPIPPMSMPSPLMNKKSGSYACFLYLGNLLLKAKGILVNTAQELEPRIFKAITDGLCVEDRPTPPVYPIGPVIKVKGDIKHDCTEWLDAQPPSSVVFLCFGSLGCFDAAQVKEMAVGLERSRHRFLWTLRVPSKPGNVLTPVDADLETALPEGFLERTKERGLVWPTWAPQTEILSHKAVGVFVTHGGWNSSLESLWFGVPMIPWPLYAEQHLNAFQLVREMGVAVELEVDRKRGGFVEAAELERAVRCLMEEENSEEGKKAREKAKEMRVACRKAVDRGGSSYGFLQKLAEDIGKRSI
ncbi:malvidin galactosylase UGT88C3-like [Typha latifolia]|uniref:malvidin galactosylase UGT88C3-like n=1 Tax=Typha latifolia TaxID=4733 RepID=UPI003C2F3B9A